MTNSLDAAKQTLAQLHADTMREEFRLRRMHGAGADHFLPRIDQALPTMTDADLDGYHREAGALMAVRNGARPHQKASRAWRMPGGIQWHSFVAAWLTILRLVFRPLLRPSRTNWNTARSSTTTSP